MWQKTTPHSAHKSDISVRWLDHNNGVEYQERGRTIIIRAEYAGDEMRDTHGQRRITLYMGLDPDPRWDTGEPLTDAGCSQGSIDCQRGT